MILIDNHNCRLAAMALAAAVLVAAPAFLVATPAMAGPLVVRANGPSAASFKPGQRLPDAPLVLKAGDVVTVLDKLGTRDFSGPGSFDFGAASRAAAPVAFTELLTQKPERRARIGAVRGFVLPGGPPVPPGIWAVDSGMSGTVCALDTSKMALWRSDTAAAAMLKLTRSADGKTADVGFGPGQAVANWPVALVATNGDSFAISGASSVVKLTVRQISARPDALDALGAALLENGCQSQFERLATATSKRNG